MPLPHTAVAPPEWIREQEPADWLRTDEFTVFAAWRSERRKAEWLAGRLAAKRLMREEWGVDPHTWAVARDGVAPAMTGRALPNIVLSLSHSAGLGAATWSPVQAEGSAGIDVQRIRPVHPGLCARVFALAERAQIADQFGSENDAAGMLLFWALKEAAIKARRLTWGRPLQSIHVRLGLPGIAEIDIDREPAFPAHYERLGDWWLARAVQPPVGTYPAASGG